MHRYASRPHRPVRVTAWDADMWTSDGTTEGRDVIDSGDWSQDQPTGLLDASGNMIYRLATRIGFMADN